MLLKYNNSTEFSSIVRHFWYSIDQEGYSIKTVSNDQWWPLSSYLGVVGTLLNLSVLYMFVQVHTQHWTNLVLLTISINTFIKYAIALTYNIIDRCQYDVFQERQGLVTAVNAMIWLVIMVIIIIDHVYLFTST